MSHNNIGKLVDHLFRHESGKMVSMLTRTFGTENLEMVEDVVQDALLQATQLWPVKGVPDNPSAWLYRAARNKAIDVLRRNSHSVKLDADEESAIPDSAPLLPDLIDEAAHEEVVKDDMLRMMFVCCHPAIPEENQITLILKVLCGFSTAEIARAFLTSEDTISKRLYRTKEFFRAHKIRFEVPSPEEVKSRTNRVLNSIYLLFNEGYNSTDSEELIRKDLMEEAMLLCKMLTENPLTQQPETFALMALMCFQASRNESRISPEGEMILLAYQDRSKWDMKLIALGNEFMNKAAYGNSVSRYHLEAAIAFEHCTAENYEKTNWGRILELYEWLSKTSLSPILELNKAVATMQVHGHSEALKVLMNIQDRKIESYYLYHSLLGEIYLGLGKNTDARSEFEVAINLTKSETEKRLLKGKISGIAKIVAAAG